MDLLADVRVLSGADMLYKLCFVLLFFIIWSDLMILRFNIYIALILGLAGSFYATRYFIENNFFD